MQIMLQHMVCIPHLLLRMHFFYIKHVTLSNYVLMFLKKIERIYYPQGSGPLIFQKHLKNMYNFVKKKSEIYISNPFSIFFDPSNIGSSIKNPRILWFSISRQR
jgi:hypothetical protein